MGRMPSLGPPRRRRWHHGEDARPDSRARSGDPRPTQPREVIDWNKRPGAAEPTSDRLILDGRRPIEELASEAVEYIRSGKTVDAKTWKRGGGTSKDWTGKLRKGVENRGIWSGHP
jgi:hypothetical protein